jgi:Ca2+/Na+ antiporter
LTNKYFRIFLLLFISLFQFFSYSQDNKSKDIQGNHKTEIKPPAEDIKIDTVKVGVYVFSIYDLDFPGNKVSIDFYIWYLYKNDSLNLNETFDLVNSKEAVKTGETAERKAGYKYVSFRCNSVIKKQWDIKNFPFDRQQIEIEIEDVDNDNSKLVFIADSLESKLDKEVRLEGYAVKNFVIKSVEHTYETTYGDPTLKPGEYSTYSRIVVYFTLERTGGGIFFKLFMGLFISVLISILTFFINPVDLDPRFGLSVGAIFAAIASQYVISTSLPQNQMLTLVDILHDISFIFIFLCILVSAVSLHFIKTGRESSSKKLDKYSFIVFSLLYIGLVIYFVSKAVS